MIAFDLPHSDPTPTVKTDYYREYQQITSIELVKSNPSVTIAVKTHESIRITPNNEEYGYSALPIPDT